MTSGALDCSRLDELARAFTPDELRAMLGQVVDSIAAGLTRLERVLAGADLEAAADAAHLCRNDALVVGARELQRALEALETAARKARPETARSALDRARAAWPAARRALLEWQAS